MIHINSYKLTPAITATWGDITGNVSNQSDLVEYINEHGTAAWGSISGNISDQSDLVEYINEHGTAAWGSISGNISDQVDLQNTLGSYATQDWISSQQFVTESWVSEQGYLVSDDLSQYATRQWVTGRGYATESWVSSNFISTTVLSDYLLKSNVSGDKQMVFSPESPNLYMRNALSSQLTINPTLITLFGDSYSMYLTSNAMGLAGPSDIGVGMTYGPVELSSEYTLTIRGSESNATFIGLDNIYLKESGSLTTIPFSNLKDMATQSWISSQQFATQTWVTGRIITNQMALQNWVQNQGYVNNSQVVSIFNDCNPLVYDVSNPLTYQERYSALKYVMPSEEHMTNPLVLGYWVEGQPNSTISEYTTVEVEGPDIVQKTYVVSLNPRTGQATSVEETGNWHPCWLELGSYPLMMTYNIGEETGSPTDRGVVWATDYEYGILIGANTTGVDGEFEGLRIDPEGVIGKYVVTGEEDEETGEMTYTDEMYPFATESWVTEQITNSIGSAMSITNQILS